MLQEQIRYSVGALFIDFLKASAVHVDDRIILLFKVKSAVEFMKSTLHCVNELKQLKQLLKPFKMKGFERPGKGTPNDFSN